MKMEAYPSTPQSQFSNERTKDTKKNLTAKDAKDVGAGFKPARLRVLRGDLLRYFLVTFSAKLQSRTLSSGIGPRILSSVCAWSTTALIAASEMIRLSGQLFVPGS
jgi:hypothetical protein